MRRRKLREIRHEMSAITYRPPTAHLNTWQKVVTFFNWRREFGLRRIRRKEYVDHVVFKGCSESLLDTYKLYLLRAGYLKKTTDGFYPAKKIPKKLTSRECYRRAYSKRVASFSDMARQSEERARRAADTWSYDFSSVHSDSSDCGSGSSDSSCSGD